MPRCKTAVEARHCLPTEAVMRTTARRCLRPMQSNRALPPAATRVCALQLIDGLLADPDLGKHLR